jgi:dTDP-4-dehydrorhamnose 3,5-epimerase-like enzyme
MPYTPTHILDLLIFETKVFGDARGTVNDYNAIIAIKSRGVK